MALISSGGYDSTAGLVPIAGATLVLKPVDSLGRRLATGKSLKDFEAKVDTELFRPRGKRNCWPTFGRRWSFRASPS